MPCGLQCISTPHVLKRRTLDTRALHALTSQGLVCMVSGHASRT